MNALFLDALFPDSPDSSGTPGPSTSTAADFSAGNPFALPDLYPSSILGTTTHASAREANIFDVVDHKGCVTYGHHQHIVKKQRLTYQQDSVKFVPKTAEDGGDLLWKMVEVGLRAGADRGGKDVRESTLFTLPEEFRSGFGALLGVNFTGKMGQEGGSKAWMEELDKVTDLADDELEEEEEGEEETSGDEDYDLWLDPNVTVPLDQPRYQTWDSYLLRDGNTPTNPYLTEAGSHVFDAVLELHQNDIWYPKEAGTVVRADVFITCLLHLGLGRSSVLFRYNKSKHTFTPVKEGLRLSGFSVGTISSVIKFFTQCGKNIKALQRFSSRVYKELSPIPTRVALAECTTTVLTALQARLSIPSSITSIIHLESLFREPALILQTFFRIILEVKGVKDDAKLLSKLFNIIQQQQFSGGSSWLRPILMELVRRVSRAWLEVVEQWIGLRGSLGMGLEGEWETRKGFFVKVAWEAEFDERGREKKELRYIFDSNHVPGFFTNEDAEMVFECGKSLRFLNKFHPGHPLSQPGTVVSQQEMPSLDWKFSWEDLEGIHGLARRYEGKLRKAIARYTETGKNTYTATNLTVKDGIRSPPTPPIHLINTISTVAVLTPMDKPPSPPPSPPGNNSATTHPPMDHSASPPPSPPTEALTPMEQSPPPPHPQHPTTPDGSDIFTKSAAELRAILTSTSELMSKPLPSLDQPSNINPLHHVTMHTHTSSSSSKTDYLTTFAPNLGITPLFSFSQIFAVQSRLVNAACLRMFFREHNLRLHFDLLYRFLLLGDGVFTARVSYALFCDEDELFDSTERRDGEFRSGGRMGLRVSNRQNWPPASSELRLALAGLLSEAYHSGSGGGGRGGGDTSTDPYNRSSNDLPGALSFSIRDLNEDEYASILDPKTLSALDFLRINYKPPTPLGEVITQGVLGKYDRAFRLLLRLVRMRFVVDQLWREEATASRTRTRGKAARGIAKSKFEMLTTKFRLGARHFVTTFCQYIWEIAIGATWHAWELRLDSIESALEKEAHGIAAVEKTLNTLSLASLTSAHSALLDRILFLSFLRRRQSPVMALIEEILGGVLEFAYLTRDMDGSCEQIEERDRDRSVEELYYRFRRKVKMFADVVRGLSESRGYGDRRVGVDAGAGADGAGIAGATGGEGVPKGEGAVFANLLVRLEMNDCWK